MGALVRGCGLAFACVCLALSGKATVPRVKLGDEISDGRPMARWRGFNLQEMFYMRKDRKPRDFREEDFQIISEWGFNFVRLPMDYRYWIKDGDRRNWEIFDEQNLKYIDRAIGLGRKYGIHVSINMHRCPGYTVALEKEPTDLFADTETLRVCCVPWAMFARRYRGIPNEALSFNLFNEPPAMQDETYGRVVKALVTAIRAEDPTRFIVADAISFGNIPSRSIANIPGVAQATRGYKPIGVTHYLAPHAGTPSAKPVWPPRNDLPSGILAGPQKKDMQCPFRLLDMPAGTLSLRFGMVSGSITLRFTADGTPLKDEHISPGGKSSMWTGVKRDPKWGITQGIWLGREEFKFSKPVGTFEMAVINGDWIMPKSITFVSPDGTRRAEIEFEADWHTPVYFTQRFVGWGEGFKAVGGKMVQPYYVDLGREYLYRKLVKDWEPTIEHGVFCIAGEFGAWKQTPHHIVLDILEDYLALWKERNISWALWELRGGYGVLDSERSDVEYEDFRGHKLDRKMLELLQRY